MGFKGKVKVGRVFDFDFKLKVTIEGEADKKFSYKKAVLFFAVAVVFGVVFSAAAYGMATGDYSAVKALAETGTSALEVLVQIFMKSLK